MRKVYLVILCFVLTGFVFVAAGIFGIYTYFSKNPIGENIWSMPAELENKDWASEAKVLATLAATLVAAGSDE